MGIGSALNHYGRVLRASSFRPYFFVTGCCGIEAEIAQSAVYDMSRLGVKIAESASEADVLIAGGWVNASVKERILEVYAALQAPKYVVAVGVCAISGTPYANEERKVLRDIIPVDIFVSGCPPRAEAFLEALIQLQKKIYPTPDQRTILQTAIKSNTVQV